MASAFPPALPPALPPPAAPVDAVVVVPGACGADPVVPRLDTEVPVAVVAGLVGLTVAVLGALVLADAVFTGFGTHPLEPPANAVGEVALLAVVAGFAVLRVAALGTLVPADAVVTGFGTHPLEPPAKAVGEVALLAVVAGLVGLTMAVLGAFELADAVFKGLGTHALDRAVGAVGEPVPAAVVPGLEKLVAPLPDERGLIEAELTPPELVTPDLYPANPDVLWLVPDTMLPDAPVPALVKLTLRIPGDPEADVPAPAREKLITPELIPAELLCAPGMLRYALEPAEVRARLLNAPELRPPDARMAAAPACDPCP